MNIQQKIKHLLDPYDSSQTECDGMIRICHTVLTSEGIEHQPMMGVLIKDKQEVEPHFWIDLSSGERIDYRARMWLGKSDPAGISPRRARIPHGIFQPNDFPNVIYSGVPVELELLSPVLLKIMTLSFNN
ncbi:MAG: hypothetical protein QNJ38_14010 [Prochloraceae cyanobacterium]|nr:hypothetical protein [Prochloraceae cyanobacterium]